MGKTKETEQKADEQQQLVEELEAAKTAKEILQSSLDWLGEVFARVSWMRRGQKTWLSLRVQDLIIELEYTDPIQGLLEGISQMRERLARRRINQGIK